MATGRRAEMMDRTRSKLLKSARQAFAAKGYAASSMDDLTADVGLTRGALYHNFGDKKGLLQAVVDQIDREMAGRARVIGSKAGTDWEALLAEGVAYIEMALEPEVQRIVLLDGPAVLGDPSRWPSQDGCLQETIRTLDKLIVEGIVKSVDPEATARLINGAALNAALWIAAADDPREVFGKATDAFRHFCTGLLRASAQPVE